VELVVDLDQALLPVLAHVKAHRDDGPAWKGHGVDVLHTLDLGEELLEPGGDLALDLSRRESRR
jgi:hypothetical protein